MTTRRRAKEFRQRTFAIIYGNEVSMNIPDDIIKAQSLDLLQTNTNNSITDQANSGEIEPPRRNNKGEEQVLAWVKPSRFVLIPHLLGFLLTTVSILPIAVFAFEFVSLVVVAQIFFGIKLGVSELERHATLYKISNKRFSIKTGVLRERSGYGMLWAIHSVRCESPLLMRLLGKLLVSMGYQDPRIAYLSIHFRDGKVLTLEGIEQGSRFGELIETASRPERANLDYRGLLIGGTPTAGLEPWLIDPQNSENKDKNNKFW